MADNELIFLAAREVFKFIFKEFFQVNKEHLHMCLLENQPKKFINRTTHSQKYYEKCSASLGKQTKTRYQISKGF